MASPSVSNHSCIVEVAEAEYPYPSHNFPSGIVEVGEEYPYGPSNNFPYPSHNFANINIVTVKLSGKDVYNLWKTQMRCLLKSHGMLGFIDGNGKAEDGDMAWSRSDSLVTGCILGSLSEKAGIRVVNRLTSKHKNADFSAKDAWDELRDIYSPSVPQETEDFSAKNAWDELRDIYGPSVPQQTKEASSTPIHLSEAHESLCQSIQQGITEEVYVKFRELGLIPTDRITINGDTSLHVAVINKNQELLEILLKMTPLDCTLVDVQNLHGSTLLHVAVIVGNTEAAEVLVRRSPDLVFEKDNKGRTPLDISLYNMHIEISLLLLEHIESYIGTDHTKFLGTRDDELLRFAIFHKRFGIALELVRHYDIIPHSEAVLMAIAQNFPCELSFWERIDQDIDYHAWEDKHRGLIWKFLISGISKIHMVSVTIIKRIVWSFLKKRLRTHRYATQLLFAVLGNIEKNIKSSPLSHPQYYTNMVFEAIRLNAFEVVTAIIIHFPDKIWSFNEDGLNFIQYAVINRSEKIYNLLYISKLCKHQNIFKRIKDPYGNNLLHLAGRLAPASKLNLRSGAVLKLQRELQWFKEVKEFVGPLICIQKNYADETPEMVFTREHVDLVSEGETWMKTTAESYTITAALIITIVFAAAITVPGGSNQDTGIPIHNNNIAFKIFAVSDAISLFTAVTSLLLFLSILTTRFSAEDFLFKLPKRLIIGLAALFISTTAMIIAFGASLFLVFGHDNLWILIPIGVLTCLPITSFVTLQFPLVGDLVVATYGRSIFDKRKKY